MITNLYEYHSNPSELYGYNEIYDVIHNMMIDAAINFADDLSGSGNIQKLSELLNNEMLIEHCDPGLYPQSYVLQNIRNGVYWGVDDMEDDFNEWEDVVANELIQFLESGKITKEYAEWLRT